MKILIATDGSDYSRGAVEGSCNFLIRPGDTEVLVVSAYEDPYPIMAEPFAISAGYYQKMADTLIEMSKGFVDDAVAVIRAKFSASELKIEKEVLHGPPDQQIIEKAKEWNADVIVVGSHGRGFWGRLLGSVSTAVVQHAPCSVLVVRK
jgi:nucleotide-binding universal stress UspA family protein